jgi:hypothetical protein
MVKRDVHEWLALWGEWERNGRAYLAHLQPKSPMGLYMDSVLPTQKGFAPSLDDEGAAWFCGLMSRLKQSHKLQYDVLYCVHVSLLSMREVSETMRINRHKVAGMYERALGWVDGNLDAQEAA